MFSSALHFILILEGEMHRDALPHCQGIRTRSGLGLTCLGTAGLAVSALLKRCCDSGRLPSGCHWAAVEELLGVVQAWHMLRQTAGRPALPTLYLQVFS